MKACMAIKRGRNREMKKNPFILVFFLLDRNVVLYGFVLYIVSALGKGLLNVRPYPGYNA